MSLFDSSRCLNDVLAAGLFAFQLEKSSILPNSERKHFQTLIFTGFFDQSAFFMKKEVGGTRKL